MTVLVDMYIKKGIYMLKKYKEINEIRVNFLEINWRAYLYYRYVYKYFWKLIDRKYRKVNNV